MMYDGFQFDSNFQELEEDCARISYSPLLLMYLTHLTTSWSE